MAKAVVISERTLGEQADQAGVPARRPMDAPVLSPEAALVVMEDGNGCVLDMDDKYYVLSKVGTQMLRAALERGVSVATEEIAASYDADPARIAGDLGKLIADMRGRGIVTLGGARTGKRRGSLGAAFVASLASALFRCIKGSRARATIALTLSRLSFALFGWSATVSAWKRRLPAPSGTETSSPERARVLASAIDKTVRMAASRNLFGANCKERALACQAMAQSSGLAAELVIGVALYPLGGHCWCEIGARIVSDDPGNCERYMPVFRYA